MSAPDPSRSRVDVWLWCVRVHKTRQLAKTACLAGHVRVNGKKAKPATAIGVGDTVEVTTPRGKRILETLACPSSRVSASLVSTFVLDHTPPDAPPGFSSKQIPAVRRERGLGRPTKKDRRAIEKWEQQTR